MSTSTCESEYLLIDEEDPTFFRLNMRLSSIKKETSFMNRLNLAI